MERAQQSERLAYIEPSQQAHALYLLDCYSYINRVNESGQSIFRILPIGLGNDGAQQFVGLSKLRSERVIDTNIGVLFYESAHISTTPISQHGAFYKDTTGGVPAYVRLTGVEFSRKMDNKRLAALCDMLRAAITVDEL